MGTGGRRARRPAADRAREGERLAADVTARVAARPSLLRQLLGRATPYGGYTTHLVVGFSTPERRTRVATVGTRLPVRVSTRRPGKIAIDTIALFGE